MSSRKLFSVKVSVLAVLLCIGIMVLASAALAEVTASGTCSTGLNWTLDDQGHLDISGTGAMPAYTNRSTDDWRAYKSDIISVTISEGVTDIGQSAFHSCQSLSSISIPSTVTGIGQDAFMLCGALEPFDIPGTVKEIGAYAFFNCVLFEELNLAEGLKIIGESAFQNCTNLQSAYIPSTVERISTNMFNACPNLTSLTVSEQNGHFLVSGSVLYNMAKTEAWYCLPGTASVSLPNTLRRINPGAFRDCVSLTSVSVPDGVTFIGNQAFASCNSLRTVRLPASMVTLMSNAFDYDNALTDVYYGGTQARWEALVGTGTHSLSGKQIHYGDDDGSGVTVLDSGVCASGLSWTLDGQRALTVSGQGSMVGYTSNSYDDWRAYRDAIVSAAISEGVTDVGAYAFYNCSKLVQVSLPNGITSIGKNAFYGCALLTEITIPASAASIDSRAFYGCTSLNTVYCYRDTFGAEWAEAWAAEGGGAIVYLDGDEPVEITRVLTLPEDLSVIEEQAFVNLNVQMVVIPEGTVSIGKQAFMGCGELVKVVMPDSITSIGEDAFKDCDQVCFVVAGENYAAQYAHSHGIAVEFPAGE